MIYSIEMECKKYPIASNMVNDRIFEIWRLWRAQLPYMDKLSNACMCPCKLCPALMYLRAYAAADGLSHNQSNTREYRCSTTQVYWSSDISIYARLFCPDTSRYYIFCFRSA